MGEATRADLLHLAACLSVEQIIKMEHCLGWRFSTKHTVRWRFQRNYYCVPADGDPDWESMPASLREKEPGNNRVWRLTSLGVDVARIAIMASDVEDAREERRCVATVQSAFERVVAERGGEDV